MFRMSPPARVRRWCPVLVLVHVQDVEPFLDRVKDSALHHSLQYGVGLITETQVHMPAI
jgi:hypothetical protein